MAAFVPPFYFLFYGVQMKKQFVILAKYNEEADRSILSIVDKLSNDER